MLHTAGDQPAVVLIDEGQLLYNQDKTQSANFWLKVKSLRVGGDRVRVVLAAAYGTKRSSAAEHGTATGPPSPTATPINISTEMTVGIFPSADGQSATLQLTEAEWSELWNRFCSWSGLQLGVVVHRYIYDTCAGQVSVSISLCCGQYIYELLLDRQQLVSSTRTTYCSINVCFYRAVYVAHVCTRGLTCL
jgi:hypothetical protein